MSNEGLFIIDPETGQERWINYDELERETIESFARPIGGFVFPANLFIRSALPAVPFYVRDWLPKRGKSIIYAPPKVGKSFIAMQMSRCIAYGEPFLGLPTTKGKVLYIQFELGEEILQGRLKSTGKEYDDVYIGTTFSMKLDIKEGQAKLLTAMTAVSPDVLILDPWAKMIAGDENEGTDVRKITDFLDTVIESFGCSILIIHHAGKDITKRGRGSSILEGWVDSYIQMTKISKNGEDLKVRIRPIFLRHAALPPEPIEATLGEDFEFQAGAVKTIKEQVREFVVKALSSVSPGEIFKAEIGSNTSVYKSLKSLVEEGKIEKTEWGKYKYGGLTHE